MLTMYNRLGAHLRPFYPANTFLIPASSTAWAKRSLGASFVQTPLQALKTPSTHSQNT